MITEVLMLCFLLVLAQNLLFSGGYGISEVISTAVTKKRAIFCGLTSLCAIFLSILSYGAVSVVKLITDNIYIVYTAIMATAVVLYVIMLVILHILGAKKSTLNLLLLSAFNSAVLVIPFAVQSMHSGFIGSIFLAIGGAAGYSLAMLLVSEGIKRLNYSDMPKAFKGAPAVIIFIGILAMAFASFSGIPFSV
ncbi:MAG TPA: hypothetical protein H9675_03850 [Firmicutes bacterium]|nr:hypothetical protein [Bacillota bacterium]